MSDAGPRGAAPPLSLRLGAFAAGLGRESIPPEIAERARHLMLDALGCALAARGEPFATTYTAAIAELAGPVALGAGRAVIGHASRLPMRDAAMLNGVLAHGLDFDDTHIAGIAHLSVAVLPAVLALAAERSLPGSRALTAYVAGLEAGSRLAGAAPGLFHAQGFHPTVAVGVFASTIACAHLVGLDPEGIARAQGFALSMASGTLQFVEDGAWTKRLHPGWAASAGIAAAVMAQHAIPTPTDVYEGRFGLYRAFLGNDRMPGVDLDSVAIDLGRSWKLLGIAVKPFPVCHFNHACADAAIALSAQLAAEGVAAERIARIEARVPEGVMPAVCVPVTAKRTPTTDYEAKFSLPYAIASGLLRGSLGLADLLPEAIADARVRSLMQRIDCVPDPGSTFPAHYTGEVVVTTDDGRRFAHREAINRGHAERPLAPADIRAKFRANAALWFSASDIHRLEDAILDLDRLPDLRELEPLLALTPIRSS
jgi:2-methylcitrate dehydratase PrpD